MVTVDIKDLDNDVKEEISGFLESKLPIKTEREGDKMTFTDKDERTHVRSPEIRTYLKRFIHTKKIRKKFRLLNIEGDLKFVKLRSDQIEEEDEEEEE
jgi:hypothetical protein